MFNFSKKFLFFLMLTISSITFVNMLVLYWFPIQIPLSSFFITGLMSTAYFLKVYYLIPICLLICVVMFLSAFSFLKEKIFLPVVLLIYLFCELCLHAYSFFSAWFHDAHFSAMQAVHIVISITIITFMHIYLTTRKTARTAGDDSLS